MRVNLKTIFIVGCFFLAACSRTTCPPEVVSYLNPPYPTQGADPPRPETLTIGRQGIAFDDVISGPLCNDTWSGTVYVRCDLQIPAWEEEPLFFEDCDLKIAPDTVVYVEAHGDQPYYQGCSCHDESTE